jgi:hypothetical protein
MRCIEGHNLESIPDVMVHFRDLRQPLFRKPLPFGFSKTALYKKDTNNGSGQHVGQNQDVQSWDAFFDEQRSKERSGYGHNNQ